MLKYAILMVRETVSNFVKLLAFADDVIFL